MFYLPQSNEIFIWCREYFVWILRRRISGRNFGMVGGAMFVIAGGIMLCDIHSNKMHNRVFSNDRMFCVQLVVVERGCGVIYYSV